MGKNLLIVVVVVAFVGAVAYFKGSPCSTGQCGSTAKSCCPSTTAPASATQTAETAPAAVVPAGPLPKLVELGAGKCVACKRMKPIIEQLDKEYADRLEVLSLDVIQQADEAAAYHWRLIPTQVFVGADGEELWRHIGYISKKDILAKWKELGVDLSQAPGKAATTQPSATNVMEGLTRVSADADAMPQGEPEPGVTITVYYFHRTERCPTCLAIEALVEQAVQSTFEAELAGGLVEHKVINFETKGNEHFEEDYDLTAQALVLVKNRSGSQVSWKNLPAIWELVDDPIAFSQYVEREVKTLLLQSAVEVSQLPSDR